MSSGSISTALAQELEGANYERLTAAQQRVSTLRNFHVRRLERHAGVPTSFADS